MPSAKREGGPLPPPPLCRTKDPEYRSSGKKKWRGSECVLSISNAKDPLPPTLTAAATHYSSRRGHPHTYVLCPLPLLISTRGQPPPQKKSHKRRPPSLPPLLSQEQSKSRWYIRTHRGGYNTAHKVCIAVGIVHTHVLCKHTHRDRMRKNQS